MYRVWYEDGSNDEFIELNRDKEKDIVDKFIKANRNGSNMYIDLRIGKVKVMRVDLNDEETIYMSNKNK